MKREDIYKLLIIKGFFINNYQVMFSTNKRFYESFDVSIRSTEWIYVDDIIKMINDIGFSCDISNSYIELNDFPIGTRFFEFNFHISTWLKEGIQINKTIRKHKFL